MVSLVILVHSELAEGAEGAQKIWGTSGNFFESGHCPEPIYFIGMQGLALAKKVVLQQPGLGSD